MADVFTPEQRAEIAKIARIEAARLQSLPLDALGRNWDQARQHHASEWGTGDTSDPKTTTKTYSRSSAESE